THDNIVIETIKPCEDAENAMILRLYECEGSYTATKLQMPNACTAGICDMMEREIAVCDGNLTFEPFEIKTIKIKRDEDKT
ncbi:MAG: glycosyl hydrolase-related protein, partial [Ruthenibacterium sp.]